MSSRRKSRSRHRAKADPLALAVGRRVRDLRREQDYSFDAFVEETGLGRGYVSELERGLVVPTVHSLAKIARALKVTVADLVLGGSEREQLMEAARTSPPRAIRELLDHAQQLRRS